MYIKINNKKIDIFTKSKFIERFTGLKFVLNTIDYGIKYPRRSWFNTNFLCQKVDIVMTDKNEAIIKMYENFKTEKSIWPKFKVKNVYLLPLGSVQYLNIGDTLKNYNNKKDID